MLRESHRRLGPRRGEEIPALKGAYEAVVRGGDLGAQPGQRNLGHSHHKSPQFTTLHQKFPYVNNFVRTVGTWW